MPSPVNPPGLSVRSVILSALLGVHPDPVPPAQLVTLAHRFEMSDSSVRVALSRAVASGDLHRTKEGYVLGARLLQRHRRQDEGVTPRPRRWLGEWETAFVVVKAGRPSSERVALRTQLADHRLAELREGVWLRPANLARTRDYADHPDVRFCESSHPEPRALAAELWDLQGWAETGRKIVAELDAATRPVDRFAAAATLVRHLTTDPILPPELLPRDWVGDELRATYADYQEELRRLVTSTARS